LFGTIYDEFVDFIEVPDDGLGFLSNIIIVDALAVFLFFFFKKINNGLLFIYDGINLKKLNFVLDSKFNGLEVI
jgi:hypothetical protein